MTIEINEEQLQAMIDKKINAIIDTAIGNAARKYVDNSLDTMIDRENRYRIDSMRQYISDAVEKAVKEKIETESIFTPEYMLKIVNKISTNMSNKMSHDIQETIGYALSRRDDEGWEEN